MLAQYLAIDGSIVTIEADAELGDQVTRAGWAIVPALMQGQPFTAYPPEHSGVMERAVRDNLPDVVFHDQEEFAVKDGNLRVGVVGIPGNGDPREVTVGAWEGQRGCLITSLSGARRDLLVEVFDTLQFSEDGRGIRIDSPILLRPRPPELLQDVPGLGMLWIRPAVASEIEFLPRAQGRVTEHGELFRIRSDRNALLLLGQACVVRIYPHAGVDTGHVAEVAERMRVEWVARVTPRTQ